MPLLIGVVALVGALCLLNLLMMFGVLRRLREHTAMLQDGVAFSPPVIGLAEGQRPEPFTAVSTAGRQVSNATDLLLVAFFSTSCSICRDRVVPFTEYLAANGAEAGKVLAVVVQDGGTAPPYLHQLEEAAMVCTELEGAEIATAFKVSGFPAFCLLDADGTVAASGFDPAILPALAGA